MTNVILLLLASLLSSGGQLCQKQAALLSDKRKLWLWLALAVGMLAAGMAVWLAVLQRIPVSLAYPMLSLNFVWVTLAARFIWRERVTARHWLGVALIILGIVLLGGNL
ncbi:4-amino-4-deoxy-L-arabinose-phosphoundecaprenol flippase subunit ArnE [Pseudocitrobacter cyperus]|uniref:Probable 4-amino-4-deoxy-L-arabinose-phosphoundecaprenol flippase subunit ArnE n=1 Tax=Pseudocitrobacter cyperus TaxID=3112843 RepID=A0ABV0HP50_9ENTR